MKNLSIKRGHISMNTKDIREVYVVGLISNTTAIFFILLMCLS